MIGDQQLARMRQQTAARLPQVATIESATRVSDGAGGWVDTWTPVANVACRLDPLSKATQVAMEAGQERLTVRYQLTVPHDAPIAPDRRVTIEGNVYEIVQMDADHAWRVARRAIVAESR